MCNHMQNLSHLTTSELALRIHDLLFKVVVNVLSLLEWTSVDDKTSTTHSIVTSKDWMLQCKCHSDS